MSVSMSIIGNGFQFFSSGGLIVPLNGGKLYTYQAGTSTPEASYTDAAGAVANSNPIILNSDGRPPSEIWLTDGVGYKFVLQDSAGVQIATYDNVSGAFNSVSATGTFSPSIAFGGASVGATYTERTGNFFVASGICTFFLRIRLTAKGSSTGGVTVEGMPFPFPSTIISNENPIGSVAFRVVTYGTGAWYVPTGIIGTSSLSFFGSDTGAGFTLDDTNFGNTSRIAVCGSYPIA